MTQVAFHFNVDNRLRYSCRLVRKAVACSTSLVVTGSSEVLAQFDRDLWALSATDFLPHARVGDPASLVDKSAVLLCESLSGVPSRDVLLNLADTVPVGFEGFNRLIEVVTADPMERSQARLRWKHYTKSGLELIQHDLGLRTTP